MNNLERDRKIRDLTRADLGITRFLIWFGFGLVYTALLILCLVFGDEPNWSWWAIVLLTLAFFVLGMLIQQRFIRHELRVLSELPKQPGFSSIEEEAPLYEEPMVQIQRKL